MTSAIGKRNFMVSTFCGMVLMITCTYGQNNRLHLDTLLSRIGDPGYAHKDSLQNVMTQLRALNENNDFIDAQIKLLHAQIMLAKGKTDSVRVLLTEIEKFYDHNDEYQHGRYHGFLLLTKGRYSMAIGEFGLSRIALLEARTIFKEVQSQYFECLALTTLGNISVLAENYEDALKYYLAAQQLRIDAGLERDYSITINLALAHNELGQYDIALTALRNSLKVKDIVAAYPRGFVSLYSIFSSVHVNKGQYDSALMYLEKAQQVASETNDPNEITAASFLLARYFADVGNPMRSNTILRKLISTQSSRNLQWTPDVVLLQAQNYFALRKYDSCIVTATKMLRPRQSTNVNEKNFQLAMVAGKAFEKIRQPDSAIFYFQMSSVLKDSLYGPSRQKAMSSLFTEMETLTKQKEIKLLEKRNALHRAENQILIISIAFGSAITLLTVALLVLTYRHRKRKHELFNYELQSQLAQRKNELEQQMARILYINDAMLEVEEKLKKLKGTQSANSQAIQQALNTIHLNRTLEKEWDHFDNYFGSVHVGFFENFNAKFPGLSIMERRLAGLVRMNLTNPQIASIMNIEGNSVKVAKHRLKKKLELSEKDDLGDYLKSFDGETKSQQAVRTLDH